MFLSGETYECLALQNGPIALFVDNKFIWGHGKNRMESTLRHLRQQWM